MVETATKNGEPPPILELYWRCQRWGSLPNAGGILDQDYKTMRNLGIVSSTYEAAKAWKEFKATDDQKKIIANLVKMGVT